MTTQDKKEKLEEKIALDEANIEMQEPQSQPMFSQESLELAQCFSKIRELEAQVEQKKEEALRALAEAENVRARTSRELEESRKYAVSTLTKDVINVVENLYRTTGHITEAQLKDAVVSQIFEGIKLIQDEFAKVLDKYGVKRIDPKIGDRFDHNYHQAISKVKNDAHPENTVINVIQAGYTLHDRLIKAAMVVVSSKD